MSLVVGIPVILLIAWVTIRTFSYAVWNWKNDNRTGSVMVVLISLASAALPVYIVFFKT